jgi:hypothetical protein
MDPDSARVMGASWERLAADYNVLEGGLLPFGMLVRLLSPLIGATVRGVEIMIWMEWYRSLWNPSSTLAWRAQGWCVPAIAVTLTSMTAEAQQAERRAVVGAYYFDGWTGQTNHITQLLRTEFAEREPVWGWKDDTVAIMQQQIDLCADHDIAF